MPVFYNGVRYPNVHSIFPAVRFYEYTKMPYGIASRGGIPDNLHFTFSASDRADSDSRAQEWLNAGYSVAVVTFTKRHEIPDTFTVNGTAYHTVDGDLHDARFLDPSGHVVILAAKGRAKRDTSGFVRSI
jgi:hypothetical protein